MKKITGAQRLCPARLRRYAAHPDPVVANEVASYDAVVLEREAMSKARGFTLIEVMIAVVVVGILATIAYPSYRDYMQRAKLAEARSQLMDTRAKLEQYYQDNRQYTGANGAGFPCNATVINQNMKHFAYSCALASNTFTITATGQADMTGFAFTINEANIRATTGLPTGWTGVGSSCWVMKKDGSC